MAPRQATPESMVGHQETNPQHRTFLSAAKYLRTALLAGAQWWSLRLMIPKVIQQDMRKKPWEVLEDLLVVTIQYTDYNAELAGRQALRSTSSLL
jgi:hypothetical protein